MINEMILGGTDREGLPLPPGHPSPFASAFGRKFRDTDGGKLFGQKFFWLKYFFGQKCFRPTNFSILVPRLVRPLVFPSVRLSVRSAVDPSIFKATPKHLYILSTHPTAMSIDTCLP